MSTVSDAVAYVEEQFECFEGACWHWADLGMSKPYQMVSLDLDVSSGTPVEAEHRLVQRFMAEIRTLKRDAVGGSERRPKLWWCWPQKIRLLDQHDGDIVNGIPVLPTVIVSRLYIDGNPGYRHGNPSRPSGSPACGQVKLYREAA